MTLPRAVCERIEAASLRSGVPLAEISRMLGKNDGFLARHLKHGHRDFRLDEITMIAAATGSSRIWLETGEGVPVVEATTVGGIAEVLDLPRNMPTYFSGRGRRDLPLLRSISVGGAGGVGMSEGPDELTERPAVLATVPDAFAVRIGDDRCRPRYRRGDTLYFHPGVPVEPEDGVALIYQDGRRIVGLLVAMDERGITLKSLSPQAFETHPRPLILAREVGVLRR